MGAATEEQAAALVAPLLEMALTKFKETDLPILADLLADLVGLGLIPASGLEAGLATFVETFEVNSCTLGPGINPPLYSPAALP